MNILMVSANNSKVVKIGGKHIHQELLHRAWILSNDNVKIAYPVEINALFIRLKNKIDNIFLAPPKAFERYIDRVLSDLTKQIDKGVDTSIEIISAQDVLAAIAVKRVLLKRNIKIPVILTLHGYFAREVVNYGNFEEKSQTIIYDYCLAFEQEALSFVHGVICVDSRIRNYIRDVFGKIENTWVVFNSIDDDKFTPVNRLERENLKKQLNCDNDSLLAIVARRLVKKNGVINAVQALRSLVDKHQMKIEMLILGDGPESNHIESYIKEYNLSSSIRMLGAISHDEIDKYFKATDFNLVPSILSDDIEEATSLTMLEGMSCGNLVIASSIGGLKEVIKDNETGILVEQKSPEQIAKAILDLASNLAQRQAIGLSAHEYIKKNHGYRQHAERIKEIFKVVKREVV